MLCLLGGLFFFQALTASVVNAQIISAAPKKSNYPQPAYPTGRG